MDFRDLRYFRTIAELGSYSRAAALLHISQPALSRAVQRLEMDLDVSLFDRHGHGVRPTQSGRALAERADALLRQLEQTRAEIRGGVESPSGVLDFAVPPGAATYLIPPIIAAFQRRFPNVFLRIHEGFSGQLSDWLFRGAVDIACIHDPAPMRGVVVTPLVSEEIFLVGRDLPRGEAGIGIADLSEIPLILPSREHSLRRLIDKLMAEQGVTPNLKAEVDGQPVIKLLIRQGVAASLLTWGAIGEEVDRAELIARRFNPHLRWPLTLVERADAPASIVRSALVSTIRDVAKSLTQSREWPGLWLDKSWSLEEEIVN